MRFLLLLLLVPHVETGKVKLPDSGRVVIYFNEPFAEIPHCDTTAAHRSWDLATNTEGLEIKGTPGDVVRWTCQ